MKVSVITVVRNNQATIAHAINSVLYQDYKNIEYIVIDGNSDDGTVEIIQSYGEQISKVISEPDNGIYDAMNKGLNLATGDIIGLLNSDDFYNNNQVISRIVQEFKSQKVDLLFGDIVFVNPHKLHQIIRYYSSANFHPDRFSSGWMPAHPSCFLKRHIYEKYGYYRTDYQLAADYELLLRLIKVNKISYSYLSQVLVKMRPGGASNRNFRCRWIANQEIIKACTEHGVKTNILKLLARYPTKIFEKVLIYSPRKIPQIEVNQSHQLYA
ncbi:glycosyl transferase family 2 [Nostoc sp. PCC 7107]|nr:glycosyl transferase family 2 [Nostoc sp. PCC 7107]